MSRSTAIHWFRQDLRLSDNPALRRAVQHEATMPVYILDDHHAGEWAMGGASRFWLHHSLEKLNASLEGSLCVYQGDPLKIFKELAARLNIAGVYWNRCYEPWQINRDRALKKLLVGMGIDAESFNGSLLWEPWTINNKDGEPYKVFTSFYRRGCLNAIEPRLPLKQARAVLWQKDPGCNSNISNLELLPAIPWHQKLEAYWNIGEAGAIERLKHFKEEGVEGYKKGRDLPAKTFVSRLSPYLHFGQISPNQAWYDLRSEGLNDDIDHFCSELGWREFSYSQLYYHPDLPVKNLQKKFCHFPWREDPQALARWQRGQTGIPFVDAGLRELWETGYMHNRVRMVVASFLVKNLMIHWRHGERWFWDCLVDADLANNSASWQWVAGCGADAAPYFRIFNPVLQGEKFDPEGRYVRRYVPELARLPDRYLHSPWQASETILRSAGVKLGENYPNSMVDLQHSRKKALEAFQSLNRD